MHKYLEKQEEGTGIHPNPLFCMFCPPPKEEPSQGSPTTCVNNVSRSTNECSLLTAYILSHRNPG